MNKQEQVETVLSDRNFQVYKGEYTGYLYLPISHNIFNYNSNPFNMCMIVPQETEYSVKLTANAISGENYLKFKVKFTWADVIYWNRFDNHIKIRKGHLTLIKE